MPKPAPLGRLVVLEPDGNKRGDLLTKRMADVLHVLGWENFRFDVAKSGREVDISATHRTEEKALRAECKALAAPVGGSDVNKFAGTVQVEQAAASTPVTAYFISISGFTETAVEQEIQAKRGMALLTGDDLVRELEQSQVVVPGERARAVAAHSPDLPAKSEQESPILLAHRSGWIWLVYSGRGGRRTHFTFVHASGGALAPEVIAELLSDDDEGPRLTTGLANAPVPFALVANQQAIADRYREYLEREYGSITLEGMPADETIGSKSIPVSDLYVPLSVSEEVEKRPAGGAPGKQGRPKRSSLSNYLTSHQLVALIGPPGAGKSTAIKWIVSHGMTSLFGNQGDTDRDEATWLPIVLKCRMLDRPGVRPIGELIEDVIKIAEMGDRADDFRELIRQALRDGRVMLLVDGLDEVSDPKNRAGFVSQLRTFIGTYPSVRLVITSRPTAFIAVAGPLMQKCRVARIADLSAFQIRQLCRKWQTQVLGTAVGADDLANEILGNARVRDLAGNPLLLTTMLLVKRWLGELPRKRSVLYDKAIEVLAMTWNVEAHEPLDLDEVLPQLGYVAYEMMTSGEQRIGADDLKRTLARAREEMPEILGYARTSVGAFINAVEHRSSIISLTDRVIVDGRVQAQYEFKHLVFQEFLAARAVLEHWHSGADAQAQDYVDILRPHFVDPAWQEPIRLAAMLAGRRAGRLIAALAEFDGSSADQYKVANILADSFTDEIQVAPEIAHNGLEVVMGWPNYESELRIFGLLNGKFRDVVLDVAEAAIMKGDDGASNGCVTLSRMAMLEHKTRDPWWLCEVEGGVRFARENLDADDLRTRLAAISVAMEAGYFISGGLPVVEEEASEVPELDIEAIVALGEVLKAHVLSGTYKTPTEWYAVLWAMAWHAEKLSWNGAVVRDFLNAVLNAWTVESGRQLERMASWCAAEIFAQAPSIGLLELSGYPRARVYELLDEVGGVDLQILRGAISLAVAGGDDLAAYADRDDLFMELFEHGMSIEWAAAVAPAVRGPFGVALSAAASEAAAAAETDTVGGGPIEAEG